MKLRRTTGRTACRHSTVNTSVLKLSNSTNWRHDFHLFSRFHSDLAPEKWSCSAVLSFLSEEKSRHGISMLRACQCPRLTRRHQGSPRRPPPGFASLKLPGRRFLSCHHRPWGPAPPPLSPGCLTITTKRFQAGARPHRQPDALN